MFNLFITANQATIEDSEDPLDIASYSYNDDQIQFEIQGIGRLYWMHNHLDSLDIVNDEKVSAIQWLENICVSFLSEYDIPDEIMLLNLKATKWFTACFTLYGYPNNIQNPYRVPEIYGYISKDASYFITQKIGGAYLDIDEGEYLNIWRQIKSRKR